uniref:Pre-rRNA-processing protein TSR2 homolog n=2 Tax=Kalanchoe fedtschenkoi TaxID=63787 RepID=A0A7N0RCL6_KALFE
MDSCHGIPNEESITNFPLKTSTHPFAHNPTNNQSNLVHPVRFIQNYNFRYETLHRDLRLSSYAELIKIKRDDVVGDEDGVIVAHDEPSDVVEPQTKGLRDDAGDADGKAVTLLVGVGRSERCRRRFRLLGDPGRIRVAARAWPTPRLRTSRDSSWSLSSPLALADVECSAWDGGSVDAVCDGAIRQDLSVEERLIFRKGIGLMFSRWAALQMAVDHEAEQLVDKVFDWFTQSKEFCADDLENLLFDFMLKINTEVEDGSVEEIALNLMILYEECLKCNYTSVQNLSAQPRPAVSHVRQKLTDDEDDSSDDEVDARDGEDEVDHELGEEGVGSGSGGGWRVGAFHLVILNLLLSFGVAVDGELHCHWPNTPFSVHRICGRKRLEVFSAWAPSKNAAKVFVKMCQSRPMCFEFFLISHVIS